ncbi:uncharacterized protein LOC128232612 [Mya arenaria]|uniref:uncharacterized protein LOC128232612 n=1 Tax=Mya arenaria TaxID=6604 RepID=UPI0022E7A4FF|nr:uncharacterized protein LOC128232612 [Mya arenaria]
MKKRNKSRKGRSDIKDDTVATKVNKDEENTKKSPSRSRSRGKRSLSSLFRRSANRTESSDGENNANHESAEREVEQVSNINPRVDPRGYIQRMTVREALLYNKQRGRSPNRRALKLEKTVLKDEPDQIRNSLSTSVPNLLDQMTDQDAESTTEQGYHKASATLPRTNKNRGHSEGGRVKQQLDLYTDQTDNSGNLPLDKRKYMINISPNVATNKSVDILKHKRNVSLQQHSKQISHEEQDDDQTSRRRHESFSQFMMLRETKPRSRSSSTNTRAPQHETDRESLNASKKQSTMDISTEDAYKTGSQIKAQLLPQHTQTKYNSTPKSLQKSNLSVNISKEDVFSHAEEPQPQSSQIDRQRRRSYVSPRRFSRTSRTSVTSNKSDSNSSQHIIEPLINKSVTSDTKSTKYCRQFSRDNRMPMPEKSPKVLIDAGTITDILISKIETVEALTQTDAQNYFKEINENNKTLVECGVQFDPVDFDGCVDNFTETGISDIVSEHTPSHLQRDVVVLDNDTDIKSLRKQRSDSAFKPIHGSHSLLNEEGKLESVECHSMPDLNQPCKTKGKKGKEKKNEAFAEKEKKKLERSKTEKHKRERRKSKKRKSHSSESGLLKLANEPNKEITLDHSSEAQVGKQNQQQHTHVNANKNPKKAKGILKKTHKDNKKTKTISDALIKAGRAASLSDILDLNVTETKKVHLSKQRSALTSTLSRSLDSLDKVADETFQDDLKKGRKHHVKAHTEAHSEHKPKLSLSAIVALKAKISRFKKAKQREREFQENRVVDDEAENDESLIPNNDDAFENTDLGVAKVYYENEINTSIGKSTNDTTIDGSDAEVKDLVYDRKIQFAGFPDDALTEEELIKQRQRNTRLTSRRESKVRQRQKKVINCCKKFVAFLFSHIGLCSLVVAYCILGGVVFKRLEGHSEIMKKREMTQMRQNFTERIHRLAFETTLTKGNREVFKVEVNSILKEFAVSVHKQTKEAGWDGKEIVMKESKDNTTVGEAQPEQWSYPSSLLYAITVMTTIGYGHVAPITVEGRVATIAYALLGIPLTLLCLTNIGDVMAHGFRWLYGRVCCGWCCILFKPRRRRRLDPERSMPVDDRIMTPTASIQVPTSVCFLLMTSYIMLGTFLFAYWEGWDVITGTYFCFITLSTIGFGDVVPGVGSADWNQNEKLVLCALYLVVGLALIAMCFNLVQEDVKAKCKWLGTKLGIIDKPVSSV